MTYKEKLTCTKCGYEMEIEHFGEIDAFAWDKFLDHLVKCGSIERDTEIQGGKNEI